MIINSLNTSKDEYLQRVSMFILAICPILEYYVFYGPLRLFDVFGLFLSVILLQKHFVTKIPISYILYWLYVALHIFFIAGVSGWSDYVPGGIQLFLYSLYLFSFASVFNIKYLYKYMRMVFIISSVLFLLQCVIYYVIQIKISFFLPLGKELNYAGLSFEELVKLQKEPGRELIERFSSIFTEPSHFAQYTIVLLCLELFVGENKDKIYTKFSLYILFILFILQSGAGFWGIGFLVIAKFSCLYFHSNRRINLFLLMIFLSVVFYIIKAYLNSSLGSFVSIRMEQMGDYSDENQTNSAFVRLYSGWYQYDKFSTFQKMFGTSLIAFRTLHENTFFNGITTILMRQGLIGFFLLINFYVQICKKRELVSVVSSLELLFMSFIAYTYLRGLMLIVTTIALGNYWNRITKRK